MCALTTAVAAQRGIDSGPRALLCRDRSPQAATEKRSRARPCPPWPALLPEWRRPEDWHPLPHTWLRTDSMPRFDDSGNSVSNGRRPASLLRSPWNAGTTTGTIPPERTMTLTSPSPASSEPRRPSTRRPPDPATLRRLYTEEGLTVAAVAARLGVAHGTAHKWLLAAGVSMRPPVTTPRADVADDDIRRLYASKGHTAAEIAAHLGCPTTTVYNRLQRLGVPRRPAGPRHRARPADDELRRLYQRRGPQPPPVGRALLGEPPGRPQLARGRRHTPRGLRLARSPTPTWRTSSPSTPRGGRVRSWPGASAVRRRRSTAASIAPGCPAEGTAAPWAGRAPRRFRRRPLGLRRWRPASTSASRRSAGRSPAKAWRRRPRPPGARPESATPSCWRSPSDQAPPMPPPRHGCAAGSGPALRRSVVPAATETAD